MRLYRKLFIIISLTFYFLGDCLAFSEELLNVDEFYNFYLLKSHDQEERSLSKDVSQKKQSLKTSRRRRKKRKTRVSRKKSKSVEVKKAQNPPLKIYSYGNEIYVERFGVEQVYPKGWGGGISEHKSYGSSNSDFDNATSSSGAGNNGLSQYESTREKVVRNITGIVVAPTGKKYHWASCPTLSRTPDENLRSLTVQQAEKEGYEACKVCFR